MTMNNEQYRRQVALLIRIMPAVFRIQDFAVHGGTAINLFHQNMPRYSVDIDVTYIPIAPRETSLKEINAHLSKLKTNIERTIPGIKIIHRPDVWKLQCAYQGATVKIEVNGTKRGLLGESEVRDLCPKAQAVFQANCKARVVSYTQLYGGKIAAALSRQHPRDLFDFWQIKAEDWAHVKKGLLLNLCGSDKPIIESLAPHEISQEEALESQFKGMTEIPFTYADYEHARQVLIDKVGACLSERDRLFLLSFEQGAPLWEHCVSGDLSHFPAVQWKMQNIQKLKVRNPLKHQEGVKKLADFLSITSTSV